MVVGIGMGVAADVHTNALRFVGCVILTQNA
jgi:hypothetical protein